MKPVATTALVSSSFLAAAGWMVFDPFPVLPAIPAAAAVRAEDIARAPGRGMLQDPPTMKVAGFDQRCSECHALFESSTQQPPRDLLRHEDIVLAHGENNRCLNCHSTQDRNKLVLHGEVEIGYDRVVQLCAKCHGPTWRDWERGMHGRTLGSWESGSAEQVRLRCTECHDPHAPAYAPIAPLPGPNTLRMGERVHHEEGAPTKKHNPLLRWMRAEPQAGGVGHARDERHTPDEPDHRTEQDEEHP